MAETDAIVDASEDDWAPRKLIVCCDGTWNEPYQIGAPSNVVKMVRAILPKDGNEVAQSVFYNAGVGTGNFVDRFIGGTMGVGLSKNVQSAYDFLAANYVDGDKIYLFGFSRGAYTARSLAGLIGQVGGLLEKRDMDLFPYVFEIYRSSEHRRALGTKKRADIEAAIRAVIPASKLGGNFDRLTEALVHARSARIFFIGVWDTVGALGVPGGGLRAIGKSHYDFHDTGLSGLIEFAYHALAIDERRKTFEPALWTRLKGSGVDDGAIVQTLEQVWFAGVHSNVGGGYADTGLSDIAFLWMVDKARQARWRDDPFLPLAFDEAYLAEQIKNNLGTLEDSSKGLQWTMLGRGPRSIMQPAAPDKTTGVELETCESIHWSARYRLRSADDGRFTPYPYASGNLVAALDNGSGPVTVPSEFEKKYYPWAD